MWGFFASVLGIVIDIFSSSKRRAEEIKKQLKIFNTIQDQKSKDAARLNTQALEQRRRLLAGIRDRYKPDPKPVDPKIENEAEKG